MSEEIVDSFGCGWHIAMFFLIDSSSSAWEKAWALPAAVALAVLVGLFVLVGSVLYALFRPLSEARWH